MIIAIFILLIVIFAIVTAIDARNFTHTKNHQRKVNSSIDFGMEYLNNCMLSSGRIICYKNIKKGINYGSELYSPIDQCCMIYSLLLLEQLLGIEDLKEKRLLASKYLIKEYIKKFERRKYAVVSRSNEDGNGSRLARVGASGMALAALSDLCGKGISLDKLTKIADFIISMQLPGGCFNSVYDLNSKSVVQNSDVMNYQGQAALGLLTLYEIYPNPKYIKAARKALLFLAYSRKEKENVPYDYWAMIATEKLFHHTLGRLTNDEIELLQEHMLQMTQHVVNNQIKNPDNPLCGGLTDDTRPAVIAPMIEGLISAFNCIEIENIDVRMPMMKAIYLGTNFLRHQQMQTGRMKGGLPYASDWREVGVPEEASMIKTESVCHAFNVWVKFQALFK